MPNELPHILIPGTKAQAGYVQENFEAIMDYLQEKLEAYQIQVASGLTKTTSNAGIITLDTAPSNKFSPIPFCMNSGYTDASGAADLLAYGGMNVTTKTGGSYGSAVGTNAQGDRVQLDSEIGLDMTGYDNGTYMLFLKPDKTLEARSIPVAGKDLYVDFSQGNANDNYGLHRVTTIGSPTYTNNKFNSNGSTGLSVPIVMGTDSWCIQGKFSFSNTTSSMRIYSKCNGSENCMSFGLARGDSNKLQFWASSGGTSHDIANGTAGIKSDWLPNVEYYIRTRFSGSQYLVDWSLDGITWTNDLVVPSNIRIFVSAGAVSFGSENDGNYAMSGTMDNLQITIGSPVCIRRNNFYSQAANPLYPIENDIKLNTSISPLTAQKFNASAWSDYTGIPIGTATLAIGAITSISTNPYNQNGYDVNIQSMSSKTAIIQAILTAEAPNFANPVSIAYSVDVPVTSNGWVSVHFHNNGATFRINGVDLLYCDANAGYYDANSAFYRVGKGDVLWSNGATVRFYPCKGEC